MGNACSMYGVKYAYSLTVGKHKGRKPLGRTCSSERVKLKWMIKEAGWEWTGIFWFRIGYIGVFL